MKQPMLYRLMRFSEKEGGEGKVSQFLTYLSCDRGWEVFSVVGPFADGSVEYLLRRPQRASLPWWRRIALPFRRKRYAFTGPIILKDEASG